MPLRDTLMSPSVAQLAAKQREPSTIAPAVTDLAAKCIPRYVLSVAKTAKCHLSRERAGQYIVVSATTRLNLAVRNNLMQLDSQGLEPNPAPKGLETEAFSMFPRVWLPEVYGYRN